MSLFREMSMQVRNHAKETDTLEFAEAALAAGAKLSENPVSCRNYY